VVQAIAAGRRAAQAIDRYLLGESLAYEVPVPDTINVEDVDTSLFKRRKRQKVPSLSPKKRIKGLREVELGLGELETLWEADRCLQCGMFPKK
jgi:NADH-quinone oxidoreductase subunit F